MLDADVVDDEVFGELRGNYRASLGLAGDPRLWTVVLFRPTLEAVFFQDPEIVQALFHRPLTPHEEEQRTLTRIANLRAAGASLQQIAATLNAEGHRPRSSSVWHPGTVGLILKRMEVAG